MGIFSSFARSLTPGADHKLASSQYSGSESASDRAARRRRENHRRSIAKTAAAGEAWEQQDRRRFW